MKKLHIALIFLISTFQIIAQNPFYLKITSFKSLQKTLKYNGNNTPFVSAHRGGPTINFPENCTATFENTIKTNPAIIETDISITKDSILVMLHDNKLERTTTGTGKIGDFTLAELQNFFLKDNDGNLTNYKIQTLDSILKWGKNKVIYTLDVKREVPYKMVVDAVKKHQAENYCVIITYTADQAAEVAKLHNKVMISVSARGKEDIERLLSVGVNKENIIAFIGTTVPKDDVIQYFHNEKMGVILGTMGNIDKSAAAKNDLVYLDILNKGIFILSSDRPTAVANQIEIYKKNKK
ncbi:glycerophosphodiester phosphodiesterase family protein [Flavobacterium sp.]|uniref:glycerophosphodiester phosphodiesterase family protein n=1 Tax=Flavobacterium sp. TaxID=239 RepID=UPI00286E2AC5|nr:glycerophosphodiester phosphodiesterase family protein [Flavobacterium sp.]